MPRAHRAIVVAGLVGLTVVSWAYLIHLADGMTVSPETRSLQMAGEVAGPQMVLAWGAGEILMLLVMWLVMMVAMMVPSVSPLVLVFARKAPRTADAGHTGDASALAPVWLLLLGYLLTWGGFSLVATLVQWSLHRAALLSPTMTSTSSLVGGALLVGAGIFQLTPLKRACLVRCRSPVGFLMSHWCPGPKGALIMGLKHGAYCVGCCWMLMALLFVAGVMNLLWVAAIAAFVLVEKLAPRGDLVSRAAGAVLIVGGITLLAAG